MGVVAGNTGCYLEIDLDKDDKKNQSALIKGTRCPWIGGDGL